jgi:hypothetical protein
MCPIAGGNWNNGGNAGVWTLNLNNVRGNSNNNVGFRADSATPRTLRGARPGDGGAKGDGFRCERAQPSGARSAKSEGRRLSSSMSRAGAPAWRDRQAPRMHEAAA